MGPAISIDQRSPLRLEAQLAGVIRFFQFSPGIRRIVYTPNVIESLNMSPRKAIRMRGASEIR